MNESGKKNNLYKGITVIVFVFLILIFLILRFGKTAEKVINPQGVYQQQEELFPEPPNLEQVLARGGENELIYKYLKKVYDSKMEGGANVDNILKDYAVELKNSVVLPTQNIRLQKVGIEFDRSKYFKDYENAYLGLQKAGGGEESDIFALQIVDKETLLALSEYDKETLKRIATEYEIFAKKISELETPMIYEKKSVQTIENSLNIAYIIRQLTETGDKQVYTLWINKYTELMFDIIANRYAF